MRQSVRIHSKVILDHPAESALYYFFRALDKDGQGWIRYGLHGLAKLFSLSRETIKHLLYRAKSKEFFKIVEVSKSKGTIYVKLNSIRQIKQNSGGSYASAIIPVATLYDRTKLKSNAYHIAFLRLQNDSEWRIDHQGIPERNKFNLNEEKTRSNLKASGCCHYSSSSENYFLYGRVNALGASQITIASYLNKSRSTVIKWADTIEHYHLFKRVKLNDPMPRHHFRCYQVTKNNKKRRLEYRRLPNQYSNSFTVRKESKARFRPSERPFDPNLHIRETFEKEDLEQKVKIQKNPYTNFIEKLATLSLSKLQLLLDSYLMETGDEIELTDITSLTEDKVLNYLSSLSKEEERYRLYRLLMEIIEVKPYSLEEVSKEYLDWFFESRKESFTSLRVDSTEIDDETLSLKQKKGKTFKENLEALSEKRVKHIAIDFLEVIGKAENQLVENIRQATGNEVRKKLINSVTMVSIRELAWLRLLTKRVFDNKVPATQHMKTGVVNPFNNIEEGRLKTYFSLS